jgi:hypothetical protein
MTTTLVILIIAAMCWPWVFGATLKAVIVLLLLVLLAWDNGTCAALRRSLTRCFFGSESTKMKTFSTIGCLAGALIRKPGLRI